MATHADSDHDEHLNMALALSESLLSYDDFCGQQIARLSPQLPASTRRLLRSNTPSNDELNDLARALALSQLSSNNSHPQVAQRHLERPTPASEKVRSSATTNEDEEDDHQLALALSLSQLPQLPDDFLYERVGGRSQWEASGASHAAARVGPVPTLTPKPSSAAANLVSASLAKERPPTRAPNAPPTGPVPAPKPAPLTMQSVVTNLSAPHFENYLQFFGLVDRYPSLVSNISKGFPIALHLPKLDCTFTPRNHYKSRDHGRIVQEKIDEEVAAGRMSGPFSREEAYAFFGGPYRTSPLDLVTKPGIDPDSADGWRMVQDMSFKDHKGVSVNDLIDSDDFPSSGSAPQNFADWVSLSCLVRELQADEACPRWLLLRPVRRLPK